MTSKNNCFICKAVSPNKLDIGMFYEEGIADDVSFFEFQKNKIVCKNCINTRSYTCTKCKKNIPIKDLRHIATKAIPGTIPAHYANKFEYTPMCFTCVCVWLAENERIYKKYSPSDPCKTEREIHFKKLVQEWTKCKEEKQ